MHTNLEIQEQHRRIEEGVKKLPKRSMRRKIEHVCIWTIGKAANGKEILRNKKFKSMDAYVDHINYEHKGKKRPDKNSRIKGIQATIGVST